MNSIALLHFCNELVVAATESAIRFFKSLVMARFVASQKTGFNMYNNVIPKSQYKKMSKM